MLPAPIITMRSENVRFGHGQPGSDTITTSTDIGGQDACHNCGAFLTGDRLPANVEDCPNCGVSL